VVDLFHRHSWHLAVAAALAGEAQGQVLVEPKAAPSSGAVLVGHRLYLAGDPANQDLMAQLRRAMEERESLRGGYLGVYPDRPSWREAVERSGLVEAVTYEGARRYYRLETAERSPSALGGVPEGFRIVPVDALLIEDAQLGNREALLEELVSERESAADFLERSFGIVLIHERAVAGWCLSEYNLDGRCEVGIGVQEPFRRRGLATLLGQTFIRQAVPADIREIGWHCWAGNVGSSATAERLGFALVGEYPAFVVKLRG
jgi:RimJ/RimL family protein N-acetyltransferase